MLKKNLNYFVNNLIFFFCVTKMVYYKDENENENMYPREYREYYNSPVTYTDENKFITFLKSPWLILFFLILIIILVYFCCCRKKSSEEYEY